MNDAGVTVDDLTFAVPGYTLQPTETDFGLRLGGGEAAHVVTVTGNASIRHRLLGTQGFTKEGSGVLSIGAANHSLIGTITINAGEVRMAGGFQDPELTIDLADLSNAKLTIDGQGLIAGGLSGGGSSGGEVRINGGLTVGGSNTNSMYRGVLSGNGVFTKNGSGTLTLTNSNSTLTSVPVIANGAIAVPELSDDGILSPLGLGGAIDLGNAQGTAILRFESSNSDSTDRRLRLIDKGVVDVASPEATLTWAGLISGDSFVKAGAGVLALSNTNTYVGPTGIMAGTLKVSGGNNIPASSPVSISAGAILDMVGIDQSLASLSGAGTVLLGSKTLTVESGSFSGSLSGSGVLRKAGAGTLTLSSLDGFAGSLQITDGVTAVTNLGSTIQGLTLGDGTHTGTLRTIPPQTASRGITVSAGGGVLESDYLFDITGPLNGTGPLRIQASGVLRISGNKGYAGTMQLAGGSLVLAGDAPNAEFVLTSGTLRTSGVHTIGPLQSLARTTVSPGDDSTYGGLSTGDLLLQDSNLIFQWAGDSLLVNGSVTLSGMVVLSFGPSLPIFAPANQVYRIIQNDGSDSTILNGRLQLQNRVLNEGDSVFLSGGALPFNVVTREYILRYGIDGADNDVRLVPVPEPVGSVTAGLVGLLLCSRRRRRQGR